MPSVIYDLQDTWNAGGVVFNGIKINVSNVASAVGSRLLRLDTNGVSQFAVDPVNGAIVGAATGGPQGPGTVNATGYFINGVAVGGIADGDKGDITVSGAGTIWTIDPLAVTYAKIQNVSATARVLGRFSGGAGPIEEGTGAQVNAILPVFTSGLKGLVPASGGGSTLFLNADGTFSTPAGGGGGGGLADAFATITDGTNPAGAVGAATFKLRTSAPLSVVTANIDGTHGKNALFGLVSATYGDIIVSGAGIVWTIGPRAVTYAKMPSMAASKLAGRGSASGAGDIEEITLGTNLTMSGTTLNATGGGGGGGTFTSSATAPVAPVAGDRWYNTDTGVESTYINDGNSSQWVQTAPTVSPPAANGFAGVNVQVFTASGTYTPTVGMKYCQIECCGGGGGGGGVGDSTTSNYGGAGGGSGGYSRKTVNASTVGATQVVTVGAAGAGATGSAGTTTGATGGVTSVGSLCIANGGSGGPGSHAAGAGMGGLGGTPGTGDIVAAGNPGMSSHGLTAGNNINAGANGGASFFGGGGRGYGPSSGSNSGVGGAGLNYGAGGGGACGLNVATGRAGGAGSAGVVIITEYF